MRCGAGGVAPHPLSATLPLRLWRVRIGAGAWRASAAMVPAARHGKVWTSWLLPALPSTGTTVEGRKQSWVPLHATVTPDSAIAFTLTMDTNSLSQSLDSVNTAVSVAGEEEVSVITKSIQTKSVPMWKSDNGWKLCEIPALSPELCGHYIRKGLRQLRTVRMSTSPDSWSTWVRSLSQQTTSTQHKKQYPPLFIGVGSGRVAG